MLEGFYGILDAITGPLFVLPEPFPILIISFVLTLATTLVYKYVTDQEVMKTLKEDMKAMQAEIKALKDKPEKMMAMQKDAMQKNMKYMMKSFKPMLITFIPIVFIFGWMKAHYDAFGNPDIFFGLSWLWTYIIFSLVFSIGMRKFLKVY
ncbi:MAG: EMC3/TMCO1 family protein [Nanoarchaeota archaeon]|nr:EMC3/TMCO1 family protein [Nanoarchaeota archaeon]